MINSRVTNYLKNFEMKYIKLILILIAVTISSLQLFTDYNISKWIKAAGYLIIVLLLFLEHRNTIKNTRK